MAGGRCAGSDKRRRQGRSGVEGGDATDVKVRPRRGCGEATVSIGAQESATGSGDKATGQYKYRAGLMTVHFAAAGIG